MPPSARSLAKKKPSLNEIALAVGCSKMSVSYALRNDQRISSALRQRIVRVARRLGYTPDAALSAVMSHVRKASNRNILPIAWINTDDRREDLWRNKVNLIPYFQGAQARCAAFGYRLDELWLCEPGMTEHRLSRILYQRGIKGVIIAPPDRLRIRHIRLDWEYFAAVSFTQAIFPKLYRVTHDDYYNISLVLKLLRHNGYRRIGFCINQQDYYRSRQIYAAALSFFHTQIPPRERVPLVIHTHSEIAGDKFLGWLKRYEPDVVVGKHHGLLRWIESSGLSVPDDVGVVHLGLEGDCDDWAGIISHKREVGALAVERVVSLININQFGLPDISQDILIPGRWKKGNTLRIPKKACT